MKVYDSEEIRRLPGLVECVSDRTYTKSAAIQRSKGKLPMGMTPGGKFILEKLDPIESDTGRMVVRYLLLWHVGNVPNKEDTQ
tara:strand:+ start:170 stop:418 length:249 start_codon:yes stop_codon:yes gene_type:complete